MDQVMMDEIERVTKILRSVWEEYHTVQGDIHWALALYPTFVNMAAAVIADRHSQEAIVFDLQMREKG